MAYYHVLLTFHDAPDKARCVLSDLTNQDLCRKFVNPYRRGKRLLCGNEVVEVSQIRKVTVVKAEWDSESELKEIQDKNWKEIQEFNRSSDYVILISPGRGYTPEEIIEAEKDVTDPYISGPPGQGGLWDIASAAFNHPWISAIGTGLIVAALVWLELNANKALLPTSALTHRRGRA